MELAAQGLLRLPQTRLDLNDLFAIGTDERVAGDLAEAMAKAISRDREERDESILGR